MIVAAQSFPSVVADHFGWVGFEPKYASAGHLAGLVGAGVVLVRIF